MLKNKLKLNILIYSDHFFPSVGGSENYAMDLAQELVRQGHHVGVITSEKTNVEENFPFIVYRLSKPVLIHLINFNFIEIPKIIKNFKPDIFHISYQTGGENILLLILKIYRIPVIMTYHADHVVFLGRLLDEMQIYTTFKIVKKILVQTERDKNKFIKHGINENRLELLNFSGVDTTKYKCMKKERKLNFPKRIISIARLDDSHKYKGIENLIKTFYTQKIHLNDVELNIVGDGNLREYYMKLVHSYNIPNIKFLGELNDHDLILYLCSSDFLVLPSINKAEGFGRVALEAISCNIPVIVSKYAGIAELVQKYRAGIVYDPLSPDIFKQVIINILNISSNFDNYINNAKQMIVKEGLTLETSVEHTVDIYKKILGYN